MFHGMFREHVFFFALALAISACLCSSQLEPSSLPAVPGRKLTGVHSRLLSSTAAKIEQATSSGPASSGEGAEGRRILNIVARGVDRAGSRKSSYARENGLVPGVVYGVDSNGNVLKKLVYSSKREIMKELNKQQYAFENTLYNVIFEGSPAGESMVVTPRQLQVDPIKSQPLSCNFLVYHPGNKLRIPVIYTNKDSNIDIKRGAFLLQTNKFVEVLCSKEVPESIKVDVSKISVGESIGIDKIKFPEGVRPARVYGADFQFGVLASGK